MRQRLQPYATEAATVCDRGCSPMRRGGDASSSSERAARQRPPTDLTYSATRQRLLTDYLTTLPPYSLTTSRTEPGDIGFCIDSCGAQPVRKIIWKVAGISPVSASPYLVRVRVRVRVRVKVRVRARVRARAGLGVGVHLSVGGGGGEQRLLTAGGAVEHRV